MTNARKEVVPEGTEGVFHSVSRCVRGAFLCGEDRSSGHSFDSRRAWIQEHIEFLASVFAVEVAAYAVMPNHVHLVLRTRPDWTAEWTNKEVLERWFTVFPRNFTGRTSPPKPDFKPDSLAEDLKKMVEIRTRMCGVSWFMRCFNEYVARRGNREDGIKGRFWEGRFKCQILLDEAAVLTCMAFVDLNPVRTGQARSLEECRYSSIFERKKGWQINRPGPESDLEARPGALVPGAWLAPIGQEFAPGRKGLLPLTLGEYIELLDWTGRQLAAGEEKAVGDEESALLARLSINSEHWLDIVSHFGRKFRRAAGSGGSMTEAAKKKGMCWFQGLKAGKEAFSLPEKAEKEQ